jgi:hypothetical protein
VIHRRRLESSEAKLGPDAVLVVGGAADFDPPRVRVPAARCKHVRLLM